MTPEELKAARLQLGLTGAQMSQMLDLNEARNYRRYETPEGAATHRALAPRIARLVQAYLDGWRPDDWPIRPQPCIGGEQ